MRKPLVLPYLESLVEGKYAESLMRLDGTGISQGNSGNYAMALHNIVTVYRAREDYDKAIYYNQRLLEMFPNYGGLTVSAKLDAAILAQKKEAQEFEAIMTKSLESTWTPMNVVQIVLMVLGAGVCAYAFYRMWQKRLKENLAEK